jgi:3-phenylpropionate/trans-cinnamate dioxygenase ferredoxin subunit
MSSAADWIPVCAFDDIDEEDVIRFDHADHTYAVYRFEDQVYATDGLCTHEKIHLADGLLMSHVIECPKHNGRFDIRNGHALGAPVCVHLNTYPCKVEGDQVLIQLTANTP